MTAKYGKISVGCFVAIWPVVALLVLLEMNREPWHPVQQHLFFAFPWTLICVLLGIILGIVGLENKESPKKYAIIGLCLHSVLVLLFITFFILMETGVSETVVYSCYANPPF